MVKQPVNKKEQPIRINKYFISEDLRDSMLHDTNYPLHYTFLACNNLLIKATLSWIISFEPVTR
jgi:hypothetical protein